MQWFFLVLSENPPFKKKSSSCPSNISAKNYDRFWSYDNNVYVHIN